MVGLILKTLYDHVLVWRSFFAIFLGFFAIYILPSAFFGLFHTQQRFAECPIKNNWQRVLCRMIGCRVGFAVCGTQQNLCTWQRCTANYWNHVVGAKAVPWHRGWHGASTLALAEQFNCAHLKAASASSSSVEDQVQILTPSWQRRGTGIWRWAAPLCWQSFSRDRKSVV